MSWMPFVILGVVLLLLFLLLLLLLKPPQPRAHRSNDLDQLLRQLRVREQDQQERSFRSQADTMLEELRGADPMLLRLLADRLEVTLAQLRLTLVNPEARQQLAERVDLRLLLTLVTAARPLLEFEAIELQSGTDIVPVNYPTRWMEPAQITDPSQLPGVLPEEMGLPDELFCLGAATQTLHVTQAYDRVEYRRRLYMLLDVSGSMESGKLEDGRERAVWAFGITANLLLRAVHSESSYYLRLFDGAPRQRYDVTTPAEAEALLQTLVTLTARGGGTDIMAALKQAVQDIQSCPDEVTTSDILLISDGESSLNRAQLSQWFGEDIRLHAALIGVESATLKEVATTYHVYR